MNSIVEKCRNILLENVKKKQKAINLLSEYFKCPADEIYYRFIRDELPDKGKISNGIYFFFHGLGCSVKNEQENWSVSLEFGPKGEALAFDCGTIGYLCYGNYIEDYNKRLIDLLVEKGIVKLVDEKLYKLSKGDFDINDLNYRESIDISVADRYIFIGA